MDPYKRPTDPRKRPAPVPAPAPTKGQQDQGKNVKDSSQEIEDKTKKLRQQIKDLDKAANRLLIETGVLTREYLELRGRLNNYFYPPSNN